MKKATTSIAGALGAPPKTERITFACPNCREELQADHLMAGQRGRCKKCGHRFTVPVRHVDPPGGPVGVAQPGDPLGALPPFVQVQLLKPQETGLKFGIGLMIAVCLAFPVGLLCYSLAIAIYLQVTGQ